MPEIKEVELQAQIMNYLKSKGILVWRMPQGGVRRKSGAVAKSPIAGFPDIAGLYLGRFFAFEIKLKTGKASAQQNAWINVLCANGAFADIVRSLKDVVTILDRIKEEFQLDHM